jgi:hemerythrin-like metal-binding protein
VLLAPSTTAAGAVQLAEKLRVLMAATSLGPAGAVTGSFGVAELRPGDTCETLLKRADEAAYRAKHQGRNQVQCDEVNVAEVLSTSAPGPAGQRPMLDGTSMYAATGFLPIDLEHRTLSQAIEAFFPMLSTGTTGEVLAAFESILAGVGAHFGHEQRLMQEHGYPGRARHAGEHAHFLEEAGALLAELESGGVTVPFRRWAVGRLPEWFRLHILEHDLQLGQFLAAADPPVRRRQTVVS